MHTQTPFIQILQLHRIFMELPAGSHCALAYSWSCQLAAIAHWHPLCNNAEPGAPPLYTIARLVRGPDAIRGAGSRAMDVDGCMDVWMPREWAARSRSGHMCK